MRIKTESDFYICQDGKFIQSSYDRLNEIGQELFVLLSAIQDNFQTLLTGLDKVSVKVTSQDRKKTSNRHWYGKAIDIGCSNPEDTVLLYILLHKISFYNIALSLHNRHIHIDKQYKKYGANGKFLELWTGKFNKDGSKKLAFITPTTYYLDNVPDYSNDGGINWKPYNLSVFDNYKCGNLTSMYIRLNFEEKVGINSKSNLKVPEWIIKLSLGMRYTKELIQEGAKFVKNTAESGWTILKYMPEILLTITAIYIVSKIDREK